MQTEENKEKDLKEAANESLEEETDDMFNPDKLWQQAMENTDELLENLNMDKDGKPQGDGDFEAKYKEMLDRYQRCLAEFDNYRKRTVKEMSIRYDDGIRSVCEKLLPIVDNFERAMNASENSAAREDNFYQGVALIARQLENTLNNLGISLIETEPGSPFDTNLHYAVAHAEDENFGENQVAEVLQKGYLHKEKVLRHAMVKVVN